MGSCISLATVKSPAVDGIKEPEETFVPPLMLGLPLGSCRQAALFTKLDEALQQQQLASVARLCEPSGSRPVGQQQREERLQLSWQREKGQHHGAGAQTAAT